MGDNYFEPCWHRWERADEHRQALGHIWNAYVEQHPYDMSLNHEGNGTYVLRVWQHEPMPAEFAVVMGEWLYNLRSVLDYTLWAAAVHVNGSFPPPGESHLQYPIYDREDQWERNLYRLKSLDVHHREMLRLMQPFASDNDANFLGWINRLARIDRHRRLIDGTAYLAEVQPVLQAPAGTSVNVEWGERVLRGGVAEVARFNVAPWDDETRIVVNPRIGIDPEVAEWAASPFWRRVRFTERLNMLQIFTAGEIATYEFDCIGTSRKAEMLTDDVKTAARARLPRPRVERPAATPVTWTSAGAAKPSTPERFAGLDFPRGVATPEAAASMEW